MIAPLFDTPVVAAENKECQFELCSFHLPATNVSSISVDPENFGVPPQPPEVTCNSPVSSSQTHETKCASIDPLPDPESFHPVRVEAYNPSEYPIPTLATVNMTMSISVSPNMPVTPNPDLNKGVPPWPPDDQQKPQGEISPRGQPLPPDHELNKGSPPIPPDLGDTEISQRGQPLPPDDDLNKGPPPIPPDLFITETSQRGQPLSPDDDLNKGPPPIPPDLFITETSPRGQPLPTDDDLNKGPPPIPPDLFVMENTIEVDDQVVLSLPYSIGPLHGHVAITTLPYQEHNQICLALQTLSVLYDPSTMTFKSYESSGKNKGSVFQHPVAMTTMSPDTIPPDELGSPSLSLNTGIPPRPPDPTVSMIEMIGEMIILYQ